MQGLVLCGRPGLYADDAGNFSDSDVELFADSSDDMDCAAKHSAEHEKEAAAEEAGAEGNDAPADGGPGAAGDEALGNDVDEALEAALAQGALPEAEGASEPLVQLSARELASRAVVSGMGYTTCGEAPWSEIASIGRITSWPAIKPEAQRSTLVRCYLHSGCVSPAKARWRVSNEDLLTWLFMGTWERDASASRKKQLAAQHKKMWGAALASGATDPPASRRTRGGIVLRGLSNDLSSRRSQKHRRGRHALGRAAQATWSNTLGSVILATPIVR